MADRKNISLSKEVKKRADAIIKARGFSGLSDLIQTLIREEFERRKPDEPNEPPVKNPQEPRTDKGYKIPQIVKSGKL
jgi:hypothetical protein